MNKPDFNKIAKSLVLGLKEPEDSFAAGWDLTSRELHIRQALETAFECGIQKGLKLQATGGDDDEQD